jgi:hypothetical protein
MDNSDELESITTTGIKTETGNEILTQLLARGWVIIDAYPDSMIDKGIDHDAYTLAKDGAHLEFTWDNWDEWQIRGAHLTILAICDEFAIEVPGG